MNFYTFRMKDAIAEWPKKGLDVPIVISEFAPAGFGRGDRPAGYWRMWSIVRTRPALGPRTDAPSILKAMRVNDLLPVI